MCMFIARSRSYGPGVIMEDRKHIATFTVTQATPTRSKIKTFDEFSVSWQKPNRHPSSIALETSSGTEIWACDERAIPS